MKQLFTLVILILGCTSSPLFDGTYCADVDRYNPKTGKQSTYTLTVKIDDVKIVQMNYPSGGHTDSDEFNLPTVSNKSASFSDFNGVQFKVDILKRGVIVFQT